MSTQFLQATNKKTGLKSMLHDTDSPLNLFIELSKKNTYTGETMADWEFDLLNSRGVVIQKNYDWKSLHVTVTLGDLFK